MNKQGAPRALGAVCLALVLGGCASMGKTPEEAVTERADERLALLLKGDFQSAYEYLSPGYRSSVSLLEYQREQASQRINWTEARVIESICEEDVCNLKISIDFEIIGAVPGVNRFASKASANERWLKTGGQWYFVPKK